MPKIDTESNINQFTAGRNSVIETSGRKLLDKEKQPKSILKLPTETQRTTARSEIKSKNESNVALSIA